MEWYWDSIDRKQPSPENCFLLSSIHEAVAPNDVDICFYEYSSVSIDQPNDPFGNMGLW